MSSSVSTSGSSFPTEGWINVEKSGLAVQLFHPTKKNVRIIKQNNIEAELSDDVGLPTVLVSSSGSDGQNQIDSWWQRCKSEWLVEIVDTETILHGDETQKYKAKQAKYRGSNGFVVANGVTCIPERRTTSHPGWTYDHKAACTHFEFLLHHKPDKNKSEIWVSYVERKTETTEEPPDEDDGPGGPHSETINSTLHCLKKIAHVQMGSEISRI